MNNPHVLQLASAPKRYEIRFSGLEARGKTAYLRTQAVARLIERERTVDIPILSAVEHEQRLELTGAAHEFTAHLIWTPQQGRCAYQHGRLRVRYTGSQPLEAGLQIGFDVVGDGRPTWMIPGAFYRENRFAHCQRLYPRYDYAGGDPQQLVSDWWSFRADRAALPAVFAWNDELCAALCTTERSAAGLNGVGFAGNAAGTSIWLNFPYREAPVVFIGEPIPEPADCPQYCWQPGAEVDVEFDLYVGGPEPHAYDPFLREMYYARLADHPLQPWIDVAQAAELTAHGLYRWHYHAEHQALYETAAFDRELNNNVKRQGDRPNMHVGWVSGTLCAYALLNYGRRQEHAAYVAAATAVLDKIASGIAPCGTFWGQWTLERGWGGGWNPQRQWVHARTIAEATLFMVRALHGERERGVEHPAWAAAVRSNLWFAVNAQRSDGNYGTYYHAETGEVQEWDGAGGILWIAALLEGGRYVDEPAFRASAQRAGSYYERFVHDAFIYGAPEDVHLTPTSEDAYNALVAYLLLYEADQDRRWLHLARRAADWMMTFRWTYNLDFPKHSMLKQLDFRSRGADQASPSNQHLHNYGLFCLPEMLRLWQYTDDPYYLDRTRDNLACFLQCVARDDGDFNAYRGMVTERYYNTNCFQPKGMLLTLSHAWSVGMVLYASQVAADFAPALGISEIVLKEQ